MKTNSSSICFLVFIERKKGFNFDYGAHIFGSCNKSGILNYYLKELAINDIDFIRLNPTERFVFPDQTIEVPQNIDNYILELLTFLNKIS